MKARNEATLRGRITKIFTEHHSIYRDGVYKTTIYNGTVSVERRNGKCDEIPVFLRKEDLFHFKNKEGVGVEIKGEIRSHRTWDVQESRYHLEIFIFCDSITENEVMEKEKNNNILLECEIVQPGSYFRYNKEGYAIVDLLVRYHGSYKNSYIPCIAWGSKAYQMSKLSKGASIIVEGRLNERHYHKNGERKIAYELSIKNFFF